MSVVDKRSELVFLYDIKDANPNGDPLDSNKPRVDEETGFNLVTDVRLKRTVRDYFFEYKGYNGQKGKDIFVREIATEDGNIQDGKARAKDFLQANNIQSDKHKKTVEKYLSGKKIEKDEFDKIKDNVAYNLTQYAIDVRLFGATVPFEIKKSRINKAREDMKSSITFTGPVQFQMGRSLHSVEMKHIKGTGAFASGSNKSKKTFREEYILPYSLICFYGLINENAAQHTGLTEEDVKLLLEGMWNGTKNLISRSKIGQVPRLLLKVNYSEKNFYTGELKEYIKLKSDVMDEKIRDISDIKLDITELVNILEQNKGKIDSVQYLVDERVNISKDGKEIKLADLPKFSEIEL